MSILTGTSAPSSASSGNDRQAAAAPTPSPAGNAGLPASGDPGQPAAAPAPGAPAGEGAYFERAGYEGFGQMLQERGVSRDPANKALSWFLEHTGKPIAQQGVQHRYDLSSINIRPEAQAHVTAFLNAMHKEGATQYDVEQMLASFEAVRRDAVLQDAAVYREVEAQDAEDARRAESVMRAEWGTEYETNRRLIDAYLRGLPQEQREKIELQPNADGVLPLNDPAELRKLVEIARGGGNAAPAGKTEAQEFAELRAMMANPYSAYWKGRDADRHQARYRDLLTKGYR